jgi:anti-sigma factor ChrR (cupin superfamily)
MPQHIVWRDLLSLDPDAPDLPWKVLREGVDILPIHGDIDTGCSTALLRYRPGASVPQHLHSGHEHILILRGSQADQHGIYRQGTFLINMPGGSHRVVSVEGCLVLAIWEAPVRFL